MSATSTSEVLVLGGGVSGKAAAALASAIGLKPTLVADNADLPAGDFVGAIVSPGIALQHPWLEECRERGIPLKSELQFGCEELRRLGIGMLAVTGSKGKSSVVKAVQDAINLFRGENAAVACGNYGKPVSEVALEHSVQWAVVEVSSFQLETTDMPADTFEAAAVLNLQEDHLGRHGSIAVYHGLKRRLLTMAKAENRFDMSRFDGHAVLGSACMEDDDVLWANSYFDNEILARNALAVTYLLRAAGLGDAAIRRSFAVFKPLPHRFQTVAVLNGVEYIDDSKATSLAALVAGVKMAAGAPSLLGKLKNLFGGPSVRLIAGGLSKGDDPKTALPILTKQVKKVYLIGRSAEQFAAAWKDSVACEICGTMEKAVAAAKCEAEKGDKVLLSPGTASFDQFKSFGERGEVFALLVQKEGQIKQ